MSTTATNSIGNASGILSIIIPIVFILAIKICLGFLVGKIAGKKGYGFAGFFILGLFFFIIGLIISLCLADKNAQANTIKTVKQSNANELKEYKDLLDTGVITQEEFDEKKKQLLGL